MWYVSYETLNDRYTKEFKTKEEALSFCAMIYKLYQGQQARYWFR